MIRVELYKLLTAKKLYILAGVIFAISVFIPIGLHIAETMGGIEAQPVNGQSMPVMLLSSIARDIIPILIIILAAGMISDELRDGTFRQMLIRPVKRWELLCGKVAALLFSICFLLGATLVFGYVTGTIAFGWGEGFIMRTEVISTGQGFVKTASAFAISVIPLLGFGVLVLLFSQLLASSGAVIGISIGIYFLMMFAGSFISSIRLFLISEHFTLGVLMLEHYSSADILKSLLVSAAYIILFGFLSIIILNKRDILY